MIVQGEPCAICTTREVEKAPYRIAHALDFAATLRRPEAADWLQGHTILHLALWRQCRLAGFHRPHVGWDRAYYGDDGNDRLRFNWQACQDLGLRLRKRSVCRAHLRGAAGPGPTIASGPNVLTVMFVACTGTVSRLNRYRYLTNIALAG